MNEKTILLAEQSSRDGKEVVRLFKMLTHPIGYAYFLYRKRFVWLRLKSTHRLDVPTEAEAFRVFRALFPTRFSKD